MLLKEKVLSKNLWNQEIIDIIWHHWWKYIKALIKYCILLIILFVFYNLLVQYIDVDYLEFIFWSVGLIIYIMFVVAFLDVYLDSIVLTSTWIILYKREWFLRQNTEHIQWSSAQSIYDEQNWILDVILNKWTIKIKRHDEVYSFEDVAYPSKTTNMIIKAKNDIMYNNKDDDEDEFQNSEKFDVLVDTLWEVILDYVKKNKK